MVEQAIKLAPKLVSGLSPMLTRPVKNRRNISGAENARPNLSEVEEAELMQRVTEHRDQEAFLTLYRFYQPKLWYWFVLGGLEKAIAEELTQEILLTVWQKPGQYQNTGGALASWLYVLARNKRIDYWRKQQRRPEAYPLAEEFTVNKTNDAPADHLVEQQLLLNAALTSLHPEQSQVIQDVYIKGYTQQEIAAKRRLPLGTVKSRLRLALQKLQHITQ